MLLPRGKLQDKEKLKGFLYLQILSSIVMEADQVEDDILTVILQKLGAPQDSQTANQAW